MSQDQSDECKDGSGSPSSFVELKDDDASTTTIVSHVNEHQDAAVDCCQSEIKDSEDEIISKGHSPFHDAHIHALNVKSSLQQGQALFSQSSEEGAEKRFAHYILTDSRLQSPSSSLLDNAPLAQAVSMESVGGRTQFFDLSDEDSQHGDSMIKDCSFQQEPSSPVVKDKPGIDKSMPSAQLVKPVQFEHPSAIGQELLRSESTHTDVQSQMLAHIPLNLQVDGSYTVQLQTCHNGGTVPHDDVNDKGDSQEQTLHPGPVFTPALLTFGATPVAPAGKLEENVVADPPKEVVNQQWLTTKDDKNLLQCKGMNWRQGMWSREEEALLKSNIEDFCKACGISDPTPVIFDTPKDERKDFYRSVAKGIQRPLFAIYRKVLRMYDNKNYVGKYTSGEVHKLQELRSKYGNDWAAIGGALGRSASSVKDRCRLLRANKRTGKWTPEEERLLSEAVRQQTNTNHGESVTTGVVWSTVTAKVRTRTEKQCRAKWLNYLNWKEAGGAEWSKTDEGELILRIANIDTDDENDLDWVKLSDRWPSVRSPQWLRGKWWTLKKKVPNNQLVGFRDIVKYLQTTYMDSLKVKIDRQGITNTSATKSPTAFRSNALSSLSSQFHRNSTKLLKKPTSDPLPNTSLPGNDTDCPVSTRNIVITDGFPASNSYDTNPQNYVQFQLTAISPQPFLLHTVQSGTFSTNLGEQFVLHPISMGSSLVQNSSDELVGQGGFIVQNVQDQVAEGTEDARTVEFSQAMVQTDLSIPIPAGSITHDDLERANLQAIDDEISRNIEPLEDSTDNVSDNQLEVHFGLEEPTVVEIQPNDISDDIIEHGGDSKDGVDNDPPGIVNITMETVRNVSINVEDNMTLDSEIGDLKEI